VVIVLFSSSYNGEEKEDELQVRLQEVLELCVFNPQHTSGMECVCLLH